MATIRTVSEMAMLRMKNRSSSSAGTGTTISITSARIADRQQRGARIGAAEHGAHGWQRKAPHRRYPPSSASSR